MGDNRPLQSATPHTAADLAEAVRAAYDGATPVYPRGGGTAPGSGPGPARPGIELSLAGLDRLVDHPWRDLTVTVEAGMTIQRLARLLAERRQRLPVDLPAADRATVGGAVAVAPAGPRRHHYGTLRDYVLGLSAVDGCGQAFSAGSRVVKNAAGYNLPRLLTGSLGTLAVITQVTFMVRPQVEAAAWVACDVADLPAAERLLASLVRTRVVPAAVELLLGPYWRENPAAAPLAGMGQLLVGFEGTAAEVHWMAQELTEQWRQCGAWSLATVATPRAEAVWERLSCFAEVTAAQDAPWPLAVRVAVLPSGVVPLVTRFLELDGRCSLEVHAGCGVIEAAFSHEDAASAAWISEVLRPAVAEAGGSLRVLARRGEEPLGPQAAFGPPPGGAAVMRAIKERFDPRGILNPGRFFFADA